MDTPKQGREDFKQSSSRPPNMGVASEGPYVKTGGTEDVSERPVPGSTPTAEDSGRKAARIGDATMPDTENREPATRRGATTSPA